MIGVLGPPERVDEVIASVAAAGAEARRLDADDAASPAVDAVVAVGERAAVEAAVHGPEAPILAVEAGDGLPTVATGGVTDAVTAFQADDWRPADRSLLRVAAGDRSTAALLEASLVTAEPARMSEYSVLTPAESDGGPAELFRVRADGVTVATPAGSHGYACDAGGPLLGPTLDGVAVVPIAPYAVSSPPWVVDLPVTLQVERDEAAVDLLVDGQTVSSVDPGTPVRIDRAADVTFVAVPASAGPRPGVGPTGLEKT